MCLLPCWQNKVANDCNKTKIRERFYHNAEMLLSFVVKNMQLITPSNVTVKCEGLLILD